MTDFSFNYNFNKKKCKMLDEFAEFFEALSSARAQAGIGRGRYPHSARLPGARGAGAPLRPQGRARDYKCSG